MNLFAELRRRNVFRVAGVYAVVGWLLAQAAALLENALGMPGWFDTVVVSFLLLGLPVALIFAWAFEMTPQGVKRTAEVRPEESITDKTGRKLDYAIIAGLALVVVVVAADRMTGGGAPQGRMAEIAATPGDNSIAVLPFVDMSPDGDQEYFADGIAEDIITGLSRFFKEKSPKTDIILADPKGSILTDYVNKGSIPNELGSWLVEGIGEDFIPDIADLSHVKKAYDITDKESFEAARDLLKKEGILAGSSSGTILAAALKYCREQTEKKRVVAFVCDRGDKYLSKMFNDYWMYDQGFLKRPPRDDLTDLITRRHSERATVTVKPDDTLMQAYGKMKLYDISQLPVLDDSGDVSGLLDEEDLLFAVVRNRDKFKDPVKSAMTYRVETVDAKQDMQSLLPIFAKGHVAVVLKDGKFEGLITRTDLLNYLRLQVA